ncbi:hypothetical protein FOCC_FOCC011430 [Frankliniella occidentalis]|uniref:TRAF3-interacting protein 1 n=1 Tax=Frankliniella occidentalis TaxID=133901 RepID=A0A6J1STM0_FRAOC|nr:TRAF3-interacting protein 1 [Frankliniella occidentalis]KAE8742936.1 hypothetical protein FOCC_FOCC011430 [Frankliniella occidentalis]
MTEEVKPDVIKKTQDSLKKHIKKPPLTEKLLKKPPFRFLHDIVTNVIKETSFLDGLFTVEELNHENIKDRDGKIAFLDKLISAVKIITGIPLSVRATKIVAGHEPTKTNELLQAIGLALDKKLDSRDVAQQLRKKGNKKSDAPDSKKSSPREGKQEKTDAGKSKSQEKVSSQTEEGSDKKKSNTKQVKVGQEAESSDKKKRSSSTSKQTKSKEPSKTVRSKKENITSDSKADLPKEMKEEAVGQAKLPDKTPSKQEILTSEAVPTEVEQNKTPSQRRSSSARQQMEENPGLPPQQPSATPISPKKQIERKSSSQEKEDSALTTLPPLQPDQSTIGAPPKTHTQPQPSTNSTRAPSATPAQTSNSQQGQPQAPVPVPLARPRTAARVGSARPGAPRVRNRGEALVVNEEVKAAPVNLIVEDENAKISHEDEDENLVVVESPPVDGIPDDLQPSAPAMSRPSSQQGHLVAQILETQKELEVGNGDNGEVNQHHTEIEWEAGRRRERETAVKEVDRMRSLIQTLTRAAHPLGKLLDSLQEDVDNMQRELSQWQNMQNSLEEQLQMEEKLSAQASLPLKEQLKQLQQAVRLELDQISSAKANIISNDDRIRRLLTSGQS